jgi:ubiquinone/menaquinone biosynthesis C-methylase UbiE
MFKRLPRAAAAARIPIRLLRAPADELPLEDSWADVVVSTRVLCSVPYQDLVLKEVMRVLKPGGRLLFLEHVRSADERVARRQDRWEPWQVRFAGGCHPNRDTLSAILEAGFEVEHLERADFPGPTITRPHVVGSALKQSVD